MNVIEYGQERRVYLKYKLGMIVLEFNVNTPAQIAYEFKFTPPNRSYVDYFLKVDSNVKNADS